jgi:hypothetical protein
VVATPPSVLEQWKAELEERFGLVFELLDRAYLTRMRRERGFGVNPWRTHSRFLMSHNLLIDPVYTDPLREWLGPLLPGSLLILDEAHHAAPSSGGHYGIETKFTRAVRDLAGRFEHRLFLSATPHNGHSNSFSTLLELLDPYRFTRGVKVRGKRALEEVMVRRLKEDIRAVRGGFPIRNVQPVVIDRSAAPARARSPSTGCAKSPTAALAKASTSPSRANRPRTGPVIGKCAVARANRRLGQLMGPEAPQPFLRTERGKAQRGTTGAETMRVLNKVSTLWPNARVEMRCGAPMWCPDGHRHVGGHGGSLATTAS